MNIYTLKNQNQELTLSVDITEFLSSNNKEVAMLSRLMRSSINRHYSTSFSQQDIEEQLDTILSFPLDSSLYEFKITYENKLKINIKSFHIPGENIKSSFNYN